MIAFKRIDFHQSTRLKNNQNRLLVVVDTQRTIYQKIGHDAVEEKMIHYLDNEKGIQRFKALNSYTVEKNYNASMEKKIHRSLI